jgi:hypothetical protein
MTTTTENMTATEIAAAAAEWTKKMDAQMGPSITTDADRARRPA